MKISTNVIKTSVYNGNLTYTTNLINALAQYFPDNQYVLLTQLNKKNEVSNSFIKSNTLEYRNILANEGMLGKKGKPWLRGFNQTITRMIAQHTDLYHATNPTDFPEGITNGVVTLHDLIALQKSPWASPESIKFYRQHISKILRQAKVVFTVSEFTKNDALQHFPEYAEKYLPTPIAANPLFQKIETSRDFLSNYGISDINKPYLLYVGEIQPRKNIEGLLNAFDSLPATLQKELNIIIVGSAKRYENLQQFQNAVARMKSNSQVFHLQNVPMNDLVKLYNTAHALVYLSHFEGFGLPIIEAMRCGCPVLTSNTTSLGEVASDAAITVNPDDKESIIDAMTTIIEKSDIRTSLKEKGFIRANHYSWEKTAKKTMTGYKKAIEILP
jgi:glycosyltransferase involved in cell wall biosynthesis